MLSPISGKNASSIVSVLFALAEELDDVEVDEAEDVPVWEEDAKEEDELLADPLERVEADEAEEDVDDVTADDEDEVVVLLWDSATAPAAAIMITMITITATTILLIPDFSEGKSIGGLAVTLPIYLYRDIDLTFINYASKFVVERGMQAEDSSHGR